MSRPAFPARIAHFSYVAPCVAWAFYLQRPRTAVGDAGTAIAWAGALLLCAAGFAFSGLSWHHARQSGGAQLRLPALLGLLASTLTLLGLVLLGVAGDAAGA